MSELTLDPSDWERFRALAHRMVDDMLDHLAALRDQPAWSPMPESVQQALADDPLPLLGQDAEAVYAQFLRNILPYTNGNRHPRFWGWVQGNGTPLAMLADMLASGMNPHMAGFNQAPTLVEQQVTGWLKELMGMPESASGLLVGGGTMANLVGLAVARQVKAGFDVRSQGLSGHPQLTLYCSNETHGWVARAAHLLGLGEHAVRRLELQPEALEQALARDRQAGDHPFCVVATLGTVNTGAVDDLGVLSRVCRAQGLWLHVDGAFGALARLCPLGREIVGDLEGVDSLAFDLHKWMYLPFEIACVLVRDGEAQLQTFRQTASYLEPTSRGVIAGGLPFSDLGLELTRSFKALKVWMSLKVHGVQALAGLIEQNILQARYLRDLVQAHPELELLAPVQLNVVCFGYTDPELDRPALDRLNQEILLSIQESGLAVPSSTRVGGAFALRVAITNHRSRRQDFQLLSEAVVAHGRRLRKVGA